MIKFKAKTANGEIINSALSAFTFPAGEAHTKREDRRDLEPTEIAIITGSEDIHNDLFQLDMWADYLRTTAPRTRRALVIPYFPGARMDRGTPFGLGRYAKFINSMLLHQIILFDPHSDATINELHALDNITVLYGQDILPVINDYVGVIAPDHGAITRASAFATHLNVPVYKASKSRDFENGHLTGFQCEPLPSEGKLLIVDDICDGGGTFLGLSEAIGLPMERIDLYVSHGVFSGKALEKLPIAFDRILTTNTYLPKRVLGPHYLRFNAVRSMISKVK